MKYHDVVQGSDEWFDLRLGKITSSHFADIMAFSINKKGEFDDLAKWGESAKKYAMRIALERSTGERIDTFKNDWMDRGKELEPEAREKYECKKFLLVENGGLFIDGDYAASPDGLVEKGGIEIKCVAYNTHFAVMETEYYDTKYTWQIQGQMIIAELNFVDFVSYCPQHPKESELYIYRIENNNIQSDQIKKRLEHFKELIATYAKMIGGKNEL